ncbi:hypothetical protein DCM91_00630 [Chitinophaga costaii]|nr:hypothetical protein DCM91_00630 [Chitinophaga costaii]
MQLFEREWAKESYDYPLWRILYQALAQYPHPQTKVLFERTLLASDTFRREMLGAALYMALKKYPNAGFQEIKNKIRLPDYLRQEADYQLKIEQ